MARTKSRRNRALGASDTGSFPDVLTVARWLFRPELIGALLVVLAAATVPVLLPLAGVIGDVRDAAVGALGVHVFTLTLALAASGVVIALRRGEWVRRHRRHVIGVASLVLFSAGALGGWHPDTHVGTADLAQRSAGGDLGAALLTRPLLFGSLLSLPLGLVLLWPRTTLAAARATPAVAWRALRWGWGLNLHRSVPRALARGARATVRPRRVPRVNEMREAVEQWRPAVAAGAVATALAPVPPAAAEAAGDAIEPPDAPEPTLDDRQRQIPMDLDHDALEWRHSADGWQLPPMDLLDEGAPSTNDEIDGEARAALIVQTLASFGVDATVTEINQGPTVTQFGVEPGWDVRTRTVQERDANGQLLRDDDGQPRVKEVEVSRTRIRVSRITALQNDLALALSAPALRIEAPVPGKPMVGIEVPNATSTVVSMRSVMETSAFRRLQGSAALPVALGTGVSGEPVVADLTKMPHLLIAGATGSGKSVCLNSIITCLLMGHSPEELRLLLVDPKRVELTPYRDVPHLAFSEIVVEMDRIVGTLQAVINEMESRYRRFAQAGVRDLRSYNELAAEEGRLSRLPYWVVVIDELADLMLAAPFQVENQVVRIAQLARATGIHLVIATQRPSVDVVTGLIKANFPTRIAFAVASQVDARTVLDQAGAEKLLGRGDMLYMPTDAQKPKRLQGVFLSDREIEQVADFWTNERFTSLTPEKFDEQLRQAEEQVAELQQTETDESADPNVQKAVELARELKTLSTSMLQRRLRIGYPRAARIMDELEERGVIGPPEVGGSSRKVLLHSDLPPVVEVTAPEGGG